MNYKETNQVKWLGVRPAHYGDQIIIDQSVVNGSVIVHTVTAGKVFYLENFLMRFWSANAGNNALVGVRNVADVHQYVICQMKLGAGIGDNVGMSFRSPIEIPAGYDVYLTVSGVGSDGLCSVSGWEE